MGASVSPAMISPPTDTSRPVSSPPATTCPSSGKKRSLRSCTSSRTKRSTRPSPSTTTSRKGCHRRSSLATCWRPRRSCRTEAAIAASPTSTSGRAGPRSAARSAARRTPAAGAKPAPTPGRPTCADKPAPPTSRPTCPSPKASGSTVDPLERSAGTSLPSKPRSIPKSLRHSIPPSSRGPLTPPHVGRIMASVDGSNEKGERT